MLGKHSANRAKPLPQAEKFSMPLFKALPQSESPLKSLPDLSTLFPVLALRPLLWAVAQTSFRKHAACQAATLH